MDTELETEKDSVPADGTLVLPLEHLQINSPPQSFSLFPLLPYDLRLEIWEQCLPPPREVVLAFPQNARTRARTPDWDKQWIFPPLPISQFALLLVNHEARDFFHTRYQLIFSDFPSADEPKTEGRKAGWYFDPRKDSLCFGDGVRGLRWFMGKFPQEEIWSRLRYLDVDVDLRAFHTDKSVNLAYFSLEENSSFVLGKMKELMLVTMRVIVVREHQWLPRKNHHWRPWENSGKILKEWLKGAIEEGSGMKLAMQYIWIETGSVQSIQGHEAFLAKYPGAISKDIRRRWEDVGIFLQDGGNETQSVYKTERRIFCRNLEIKLR